MADTRDDKRRSRAAVENTSPARKDRPQQDSADEIEIYDLEELADRRKAAPEFPVDDEEGDGVARGRKGRGAAGATADGRQGRAAAGGKNDRAADGNGRGHGIDAHVILRILILAALAATIIIYLVWSRGKDAKVQEGEVTNSYSVEVNDEMVYLSESKLEGHEDDGVTTILCLGNEPFSDDLTETGLAGQIEALADNVKVYNASFPDSQVTCLERKYDPSEETRDDIFNLFYVANSINLGDYSAMRTIAAFHSDDSRYEESITTLESMDWESVDMIAIMYDAADYRNGSSMQNPDDENDLTTYTNSLANAFKLIQDKYPWIRIVFLSPYYINDGEQDSRTNDIGNGTLVNYFQWGMDTCASNSVSFLDNYYGSINENNYQEYTTDGIHLNAAGRTKIADHFVYTVIDKVYTEYDAGNLMVAK